MLRRNGLIEEREIHQLEEWIDCINWAMTMLLAGVDENGAFEHYDPGN